MQSARDRRIPYYFVAFFLGLIVVDGIMVTLAVRTQTGTVIEHPYETGLSYNALIKASDSQAALGWKSSLEFVQISSGRGKLVFALSDKEGNPIHADSVTFSFMRPTQEGYDFKRDIKRTGSRYSHITNFPLPGLWEVRVYVKANGNTYQQSKRIVVE